MTNLWHLVLYHLFELLHDRDICIHICNLLCKGACIHICNLRGKGACIHVHNLHGSNIPQLLLCCHLIEKNREALLQHLLMLILPGIFRGVVIFAVEWDPRKCLTRINVRVVLQTVLSMKHVTLQLATCENSYQTPKDNSCLACRCPCQV